MSDPVTNGGERDHQEEAQQATLFDDFPVPSYDEWRQTAEASLKGGSFEKRLITKTYEGIALQPMYREADTEGINHQYTLPGFAPYVRSTHTLGYTVKPWEVAQEMLYATPERFNEALRFDLGRGLTGVNVVLDEATLAGLDPDQAEVGQVGNGGVSLATVDDMAKALDGVDCSQTPVSIRATVVSLPIAALLVASQRRAGKNTTDLHGAVSSDPLGVLARRGTLPLSLERAYDEMAHLTEWATTHAPNLQTIAVHGHPYHNGGGNAVQELAFTLATAVDYIRAMQQRGLNIDSIAPRLGFAFSLGSNVFMEIAKLRAARLIWSQAVVAFGGNEESQKMAIHARTGALNKTLQDPYVNMLRTTVESFAGAIGGCDSMHVAPFDDVFRQPDEFSRRIARNTQIILQEECNLTRLIDPAGGSWYIETLTDTLARDAWALFQEVEQQGGMFKALQAGMPQEKVAEVAKARAQALETRKDVLVGTNMYANLYEKPLEDRAPDPATVKQERAAQVKRSGAGSDKLSTLSGATGTARVEAAIEAALAGATLNELVSTLRSGDSGQPSITPVRSHRVAEMFEILRANATAYQNQTGKRPQVFLATMGPLVQHKGRADFTTGFLEVGGFEMIRPSGFDTPEQAAKAAIDSGARIVVICSTDDTYPDIVPSLTKQIKEATPEITVILAGYPADHVESFKAAGVDDFLHLRANCYRMNVQLQQKIGASA